MSVLFAPARRRDGGALSSLIPSRPARGPSSPVVTPQEALRNSAVWACRRLRADLISTLPVDVFTRIEGVQYERPRPPVLDRPGGDEVRRLEWLYSTQQDLDTYGNAFGVISDRDRNGFPSRIDLVSPSQVSVRQDRDRVVTYYIGGRSYDTSQVWHEKQYTVSGSPVGLSPIAYAALTIAQGISAQEFTANWYANSAVPSGILRNTAADLSRPQAMEAKESYKAAVAGGDIWVAGKAWEFTPMTASANDKKFLDALQATLPDIARYMGCPADLIDAMVSSGSSITYANIAQRNLQFLTMHLGPAINRREDAITSGMLRPGTYLKFNTDALLRMDPKTVSEMFGQQVRDRLRAPSEVRELWNLPPLTDAQVAEFTAASGGGAGHELPTALQKLYLAVDKVITSDEARTIANELYDADLAMPGPTFDLGGSK